MIDKLFLKDENYEITNYEENNKINVYIKSKVTTCCCPECKKESNVYHSTYKRRIQDTPIHNTETWLNVTSYEFECTNKDCKTKTFTEELPFARKNKVKTDALVQFILSISIFLSSTAATLVLSFLGVKVSADSIDNIIKNIKITDNPDVEEIGIDDVAIRKGQTYATAIYDLKDHHLIALLEGRDAETVKEWLENHKKIKLVARDRASAYAEAIKEILPEAIQVADRFHLFENLIKYLKEIFYSEVPDRIYIRDNKIVDPKEIEKVPVKLKIDEEILNKLNYDNSEPVDINGNLIIFDSKRHTLNSKQYKEQEQNRIKKYEMVKELRKRLVNCNYNDYPKIAEEFKISLPSLNKYKKMSEEEVENIAKRKNYKKRKTIMDEYINIIYKMIIDKVPPEYIIAYVVKKGCSATENTIATYIKCFTDNNKLPYNYSKLIYINYKYPDDVVIISRYELLKTSLTLDDKKKDIEIEKYKEIIIQKYPIVEEVRNIFEDFHDTIFSKDENKLDEFLKKYQDKVPSFCNGIKKDIAPVKNAISLQISSGFVEGNNNKFKLIKRIVYGKMNIVNLFRKSYLCFLATTDDFDINEVVEGVLQKLEKRQE